MIEKIKTWIFMRKFLREVINKQQKLLINSDLQYIDLYNKAIAKIVPEYKKMIIFNDSSYPEFNGILGLKFNKKHVGYKKAFEEIIITFANGATYYWYFYQLGQKMIKQKPLDENIKTVGVKSKVNIGIQESIPPWMQEKLK